MRLIVIESPFAGEVEANKAYLQSCIRHATLQMNESPYASHQMLTEALDDLDPRERQIGIDAGLALGDAIIDAGGAHVFYVNRGISNGMVYALEHAAKKGRQITCREYDPVMDWIEWTFDATLITSDEPFPESHEQWGGGQYVQKLYKHAIAQRK